MKEGHLPVLAEEVIEMLSPASGSLQIDATVGGGGHTERILEATTPDGRLLGLDAEAVVVGSRDHAEIWAPARWDDYRRSLEDPESLAKALEGLGI